MNQGIIYNIKENKYCIILKNNIKIDNKTYNIYIKDNTLAAKLYKKEEEFISEVDLRSICDMMCRDIEIGEGRIVSVIL